MDIRVDEDRGLLASPLTPIMIEKIRAFCIFACFSTDGISL